MSKNVIATRGTRVNQSSANARLIQELNSALLDNSPIPATVGTRVFAQESISEQDEIMINTASSNLAATLQSVVGGLGIQGTFVQESAAVQGAICAAAPQAFIGRDLTLPAATKNTFVIRAESAPNYLGHRSKLFATEAFDNRETRSAVLYTMGFNYTASRQDEFGETIWPTLTLPPDQVGFGIVVNRLTVHKGVLHGIDGRAVDFKKVDLMRAGVDYTVLSRDKTRCYPIVRPASLDKFVDPALVAPVDYNNEGTVVRTAPLKTGVEIGLIGLSQTDAMLESGSANQTDTLDPAISLEHLYVKVGGDVLKFNVYSNSTANFTYAPQGVDKQRNLAFRTKSLTIGAKTTQSDGTPLVDLAGVVTDNLTVVVEIQASGIANTEFGSVQVFGNKVAIVKILDEDGNEVAPTNATAADIHAAFANATIFGYVVRAYRTNINMRENGDYIDRTSFTQLYEVPLLSPVTAQRPQNTDGSMDASDFEALVTHTRFRLAGDAVTAIFDVCTRLDEYINSGSAQMDDIPEQLGAARYHVKPVFYAPAPIDVRTLVDSWASSTRLDDLQAALINLIRDYFFRMYVASEYQSAANAMGMQGPATGIIATDPIIHRYLMVNGDMRTLTEKFNVKVVSTVDERFKGKIFLTFGVFDENRNQAPNIMNFGNLVWSSEVVMSASVPRGGAMSRETIVQPRYLFVNHLPVAAMLQLTNVPDTLLKMPIHFKSI